MTGRSEDLMHQVVEGDARAFEVLMGRLDEHVRRQLMRLIRDRSAIADLEQEVFLRLWKDADRWDGRGSPKAWVLRIATNLALNHLRTVRRRRQQRLQLPSRTMEDDDEDAVPGWMIDRATVGPDARLEELEERQELDLLIQDLPEDKREVLRMIHDAEMDVREVARALGIPEGTVKSRLHYARRKLTQSWKDRHPDWEEI